MQLFLRQYRYAIRKKMISEIDFLHNIAHHFLRDSVHLPQHCQEAGCRRKEPHQVCVLWKQGTENLHAQDHPTPNESSYSGSGAPPSCQRSSRSSGLERQKQR